MNEFVFLYREARAGRTGSPQEMQQQLQKWATWMKDLGEKGHIKAPGNALELTGKIVKNKKGEVSDGPYAEAKDLVGGYSLIEAKDLTHAAELASGCPIFNQGGFVEVRPIMKMGV
jgi:hypothetical protein